MPLGKKISKRLDHWLLQHLRVLRLGACFARHRHHIEIDQRPRSADEIVVFTAADSGYLERFLQPYVGSLVAHVPEPRLHVHLYNPQDSDFELLRAVQQRYPDLQLTWSHETFAREAFERGRARIPPGHQSWKSLYICCSRFLAARTIQKESGASLLITDIDILFNGNIKSRFGGDTACALLLRPDASKLCKRTLGGVVFVSANAIGQRFLATACDHIERFLPAGFYWFAFDQYALYRAVQAMPAAERQEHFSPLTPQDVSFTLDRDGLILYPKGNLKGDETFADLARQYPARGAN